MGWSRGCVCSYMVIGYQLWLLYSLGFHRRSGRVRAQGFSAEKVGGETREEEEERRNAARLSAVRRERKTEESRHAVLLESCLVSGLVALVVPGFLQQHPGDRGRRSCVSKAWMWDVRLGANSQRTHLSLSLFAFARTWAWSPAFRLSLSSCMNKAFLSFGFVPNWVAWAR